MSKLGDFCRRVPVVGPFVYRTYMRLRYADGSRTVISDGPVKGMPVYHFVRTTNKNLLAGKHEMHLQRWLLKNMRPGMVFYDVGANGGFISRVAAKALGGTGKVVAFEPHPETARQCQRQLSLCEKGTTVHFREAAMSSAPGTAEFTDDTASVSASLADKTRDGRTVERKIRVEVTTLDAEVARFGAPDVIKIDVEGAECMVLDGGMETIRTHRPVVLVELHTPELADDFAQRLEAIGYQFMTPDGGPVPSGYLERIVVAVPQAA